MEGSKGRRDYLGDLKLKTKHVLKTLMETSLMVGITRHLNASTYERTRSVSLTETVITEEALRQLTG